MTRNLHAEMAELQALIQNVEHQMCAAEAYVLRFNHLLNELSDADMIDPIMLLGDVIYDTYHSITWTSDVPGRVLQAALGIGYGGAGVVLWDAERYRRLRRENDFSLDDDGLGFSPFEGCPPQVRHLLLPYLEPLMKRLCKLVLD
jgi:hypothetical protein